MAHKTRPSSELDGAATPIQQAQFMLWDTLQHLRQVAGAGGVDLESAVHEISEAVELLSEFDEVSTRDMASVAAVNAAMNHLRAVLAELQVIARVEPSLQEITKRIARTLAVLYPLSKFGESKIPENPISPRPSVPKHIQERRQAPRIAIEAEVGFQSDTNFFMGFSEDVSTGGLFISTYDVRPLGSTLNLNFTLPDGHLISVDGVVRWVREYNETTPDTPPGMGVQFESLSTEDKEAIEGFIQERPALFYDDE